MALKIYYAKTDALLEENCRLLALQCLPAVRLAKVERFKKETDRIRSMAAGLLLEYALQEAGIRNQSLTVLTNAAGKPYFKEKPDFFYNLTHSGDYAALVCGTHEIGIDMEHVRKNQQKLVQRFFTEEEAAFLEKNWSDASFTRMWTRKESYLKAVGCGMRGVSEAPALLDDHILLTGQKQYYLKSFQVGDKDWLSVCQADAKIDAMPDELNLSQIIEGLLSN